MAWLWQQLAGDTRRFAIRLAFAADPLGISRRGCSSLPCSGALAGRPEAMLARRLLRLVGWNVLLLVAGVLLIGVAAEAWLRMTSPYPTAFPKVFVPNVGLVGRPSTESFHQMRGLWQRSNSLGFLDYEPPPAGGCHVAMIGDSFVAAREVPIAAKFHVRLEELAARQLPALDVSTSAYGVGGTGQISQLPLWDEYARRLRPKLMVLVFVVNDYVDNSRIVHMLRFRTADCRWACATRGEDGALRLLPPSAPPSFVFERALRSSSYFWVWLHDKHRSVRGHVPFSLVAPAVDEAVRAGTGGAGDYYAGLFPSLRPYARTAATRYVKSREILCMGAKSTIYQDGMAITAFALDEFKKRATRDGAHLVILRAQAEYGAWITEMAAERTIPIIHLADYVRRQGGRMEDARWPRDPHWSLQGHQWAAEAVLEYLSRNQHICDRRVRPPRSGG